MLRWISSLLVLALMSTAQGQDVLVDDDVIQHATVDSTVAVDTSLQLWLYINGPQDTEFISVGRVYQNQPFTISLNTSNTVWRDDTLFVLTNFGSVGGATSATLLWTNTFDDAGIETSGAISALIMKMKISTSPGDSITEGNWPTSPTVLDRNVGDPEDAAWKIALGSGGQPDSATITGLDSSKNYWFAVRSADEANNWSLLSNNAYKALSGGIDSTSTQTYRLMTAWNRMIINEGWETGPSSPITIVEVTIGVLPPGENISTNTDNP